MSDLQMSKCSTCRMNRPGWLMTCCERSRIGVILNSHEGGVLEYAVGHRSNSSRELRVCHRLVVNWRICSVGEFVLHSIKHLVQENGVRRRRWPGRGAPQWARTDEQLPGRSLYTTWRHSGQPTAASGCGSREGRYSSWCKF